MCVGVPAKTELGQCENDHCWPRSRGQLRCCCPARQHGHKPAHVAACRWDARLGRRRLGLPRWLCHMRQVPEPLHQVLLLALPRCAAGGNHAGVGGAAPDGASQGAIWPEFPPIAHVMTPKCPLILRRAGVGRAGAEPRRHPAWDLLLPHLEHPRLDRLPHLVPNFHNAWATFSEIVCGFLWFDLTNDAMDRCITLTLALSKLLGCSVTVTAFVFCKYIAAQAICRCL